MTAADRAPAKCSLAFFSMNNASAKLKSSETAMTDSAEPITRSQPTVDEWDTFRMRTEMLADRATDQATSAANLAAVTSAEYASAMRQVAEWSNLEAKSLVDVPKITAALAMNPGNVRARNVLEEIFTNLGSAAVGRSSAEKIALTIWDRDVYAACLP